MVRCAGKCLTVNLLRQLCDSHGSNGPPGPTFRTKAFESAFSGCRPRGLRLGNLAGSVMALLFSSRFPVDNRSIPSDRYNPVDIGTHHHVGRWSQTLQYPRLEGAPLSLTVRRDPQWGLSCRSREIRCQTLRSIGVSNQRATT